MIKRFSSPFFILKKRHFLAGGLVISLWLNSGFTVASDFAAETIGVTAPQEEVKGKVSSGGAALAGATVTVKEDPSRATSTNESGDFAINAKVGETLVFTAIGHDPKEVEVAGPTMNVELFSNLENIDEVVVTGYSTQKKGEISASIVSLDQKQLKDVKSPNVSNLLQGKVAGVDVVGTGRPGQQANVRIRGRSSLSSGTNPLWVVDGVIMHGVPNINPNDIENISVLKDAAATTQYGSRGTNGVIVVTTKRALREGEGVFSVNLSSGVSKFNQGNFKLMDSQQLWDFYQSFPNQKDIDPNVTDKVLGTNYDWMENGIKAGAVNDFAASYMGKTEKTSVYASANYYGEKGSIKGYDYERLTGRFNVDHKLTDRITFKPKLNASYTTYLNKEHSLYDMMLNLPWDNPFNADGSVKNPQDENSDFVWFGRDHRNYLYDRQYNYGKGQTFDMQGNFDFSYRISDRFTFESMNNLTYYNQTTMSYADPKSNAGRNEKGTIEQFSDKRITRFFNQMLKYDETFGKHKVSGFAAYEYSDYTYSSLNATGKGIAPGSEILGNAASVLNFGGTKNDYSFQSGILQGTYAYDNRYNLMASFRVDGSSRFGKNNQYGAFYSVSGAWNIHNEEFFNVPAINLFRLKASYGGVGNVPTYYYSSYGTYRLDAQYNGDPAAIQKNFQNANVSWEKSYDANVGLELGFLNRLNLSVDLYHKNTSGLLYYVEFPSTAGWEGYWLNIGGLRNKGVEVALNGSVFGPESPFQWDLGFNVAHNNNRITSLNNDQDIPKGNQRFSVGHDVESWYMRKWAGVNPENGDPQWEAIDPETGEVSLTSNYNDAALQFVGAATPKFQGGFNSAMSYKGFNLNASFAYQNGGMTHNTAREWFDSDGAYASYNQLIFMDGWSRWSPENPNATHPRAEYNNTSLSNKVSSRYLESTNFLRLRNVTLGYTFSENLVNRLKLKGLNVYVSGDNLWTSTKFSGLDPEAAILGNDNSADKAGGGDATSQYPAPKRLIFGLNLTF
jgi:TonB-linked SusC/RagA family outer membrane protein